MPTPVPEQRDSYAVHCDDWKICGDTKESVECRGQWRRQVASSRADAMLEESHRSIKKLSKGGDTPNGRKRGQAHRQLQLMAVPAVSATGQP